MSDNNPIEYFEVLGFEESEIEDGLTALAFEYHTDGSYALLTDEEGSLPQNLKQPLIFACYTPDGAYQWSTWFKNAYLFQELWAAAATPAEKYEAVRQYWEQRS